MNFVLIIYLVFFYDILTLTANDSKIGGEKLLGSKNKQSLEEQTLRNSNFPKHCRIEKKIYKGQEMYICNGQYFKTLSQAKECQSKLTKITPELQDLRLRNNQKTNLYKNFNINQHLGSNKFCKFSWKAIFQHCDYDCFSKNNFDVLKKKFIDQINMLRTHYHLKKIHLNTKLEKLAQKHSNEMAKKGILIHSPLNVYGETVGAVLYLGGSVMVNIWYNEYKLYDFKKHKPRNKYNSYTQLMWKSTNFIGCGVTLKMDILYITCKYNPSGNKKFLYKSNVPSTI